MKGHHCAPALGNWELQGPLNWLLWAVHQLGQDVGKCFVFRLSTQFARSFSPWLGGTNLCAVPGPQLAMDVASCKPISNVVDSADLVACSFVVDSLVSWKSFSWGKFAVLSTVHLQTCLGGHGDKTPGGWGGILCSGVTGFWVRPMGPCGVCHISTNGVCVCELGAVGRSPSQSPWTHDWMGWTLICYTVVDLFFWEPHAKTHFGPPPSPECFKNQ